MSNQKAPTEKPSLAPLGQAANDLSALCNSIDDGVPLDSIMLSLFGEAKLTHEAAVARRISFLHALENGARECERQTNEWEARATRMNEALEFFIGKTKQVITDNPDIPYKSTAGELKIVGNGGVKPMVYDGVVPVKLSRYNVVTESECIDYKIAAKYLTREVVISLNNGAIREDIAKDVQIPWARLIDRGTRLKY